MKTWLDLKPWELFICLREGLKKNYGIFQSWSDPSQPGNFRPELWKKTKKIKTLKNDLRVMKQILYDMGKKKYFF